MKYKHDRVFSLDVACPHCKMGVGQMCRETWQGQEKQVRESPHEGRINAAKAEYQRRYPQKEGTDVSK